MDALCFCANARDDRMVSVRRPSSNKDKRKKMNAWMETGKKVTVKFIKISVKSKSTGKTITKVEWEISIPKTTQTKGKKKK